MRLRNEIEAQEYLDHEFSWRLREIKLLKTSVQVASREYCEMLVRAGIQLIYAHWEGFVKAGAEALLCYVSYSGKTYRQLLPCFAVHGFKKDIDTLGSSKKELIRIKVIKSLMENLDEVASFHYKGKISAYGNLSYERFCDITAAIGIDNSRYSTRGNFVDSSLLGRRNSVAHGGRIDLDVDGFTNTLDEVLQLLRWFKTDLENSISKKSFLA